VNLQGCAVPLGTPDQEECHSGVRTTWK